MGLQCFERAVAIDPAYAPAYTGIAVTGVHAVLPHVLLQQ